MSYGHGESAHRIAVAALVIIVALAVRVAAAPPQPAAERTRLDGILDHARFADLAVGAPVTIDGVPLPDGASVGLRLERFEVLTDDAQVIVAGADGQHPAPRPDLVLLRGHVAGAAGSRVFLGISPHGTNGFIRRDGAMHFLSTGPHRGQAGAHLALRIADAATLPDAAAPPTICANSIDNPDLHPLGLPRLVEGPPAPLTTPCRVARVALDCDWEFNNALFGGDSAAASAYALTLLAAISEIYEDDLSAELTVPFIRVWETASDPYTQFDSLLALEEFRDYWRANETGVGREIAHLLTGKNIGGGIAYVGVVCNALWGFGVSGNMNGSFPYPLQDHHSGNWDVIVVAHEMGHNFGTGHTHEYAPPIDGCGSGDCSSPYGGTIMSYCHTCPGGLANIQLNFHPTVVTTILNYLDTNGCDLTVECAVEHDSTYIGASGGSWFVPASWSTGSVPGALTNVTIPTLVLIDGPNAVANTVTIAADGILELANVAADLTLSGAGVQNDGLLRGVGAIVGDVVNAGALHPGLPLGTMAIIGNLTQTTAGTLHIDVDGYVQIEHDNLTVSATATLDGGLAMTAGVGLAPATDSTAEYLFAASVTGTYATLSLPDLPGTFAFSPGTTSTTGFVITVPVETCTPSLDQWASSVIGFSSEWSNDTMAAIRALGAPNVQHYLLSSQAWGASSQNGTLEHITLGYEIPVYATGVTVRESYGNGFVSQVDLLDVDDQLHTIWSGTDSSLPGTPADFQLSWAQTAYLVKGVKVYIDTDATTVWEQIDAVRLHGAAGPTGAWADTVIDYSSQWSSSRFSAAQALGYPNVPTYGSHRYAWAASSRDGTLEHLTLGFNEHVYATGVTVREVWGNGFVYRVDALDTNDVLHTVWSGADPSPPGAPADFLIEWPRTGYLVKGVKIYIDTDASADWEEIDAVRIHGVLDDEADCNGNGIGDACDIAAGMSTDANDDGIPDECDVPPDIGDVSGSPDPVNQGQTLTLSVSGANDVNGDLVQVAFYRDADGDGLLGGGDALLGTDTSAAGGWTWAGSTGAFPLGVNRFFALATDGAGLDGAVVSTTVSVITALPDGHYTGAPGGSWSVGSNWAGGSSPSGSTDVVIATSVVIDAPGALADTVTIEDGGSLDLSTAAASLAATLVTVEAGGTLAGIGTITADVVSAGTVAPGDPVGTLSITGAYTQQDVGALAIDVDGYTPDAEHDVLAVTATAALDGALVVTAGGSLVPAVDTAVFLTAATVSGAFASEDLPALGGTYSFALSLAATEASLVTVAADNCAMPNLSQWASSVIDYSTQWSGGSYGAGQTLGRPDVPVYGTDPHAWAASSQDGTLEYVTVGFGLPVYATGVTVREVWGNGFVYRVDVVDTDDALHTVWTGTDPSAPGAVADFLVEWPETDYLVKGVRIHVDTDASADWEEIDAVRLHGIAGPLSAWATAVIDFSSQWSTTYFAAAQTLGEPDILSYSNSWRAWAASSQDGTLEYLTLGYTQPVHATGVTVRETWGNGFVYQVDVLDVDDVLHTVWTGTDPSAPGAAANFEITWTQTPYLVKGVRVHVDTDASADWEEIDAVQLHGVPGATDPWVNEVLGYTSQYSAGAFAAAQTLDEPDIFAYGNDGRAWAASSQDGTLEHLTLGVEALMYASGVTVRETWGNGFVYQVDVVDEGDALHTVWSGTDPSPSGMPVNFRVTWAQTAYLVKGVRIHVDTDATTDWEEIDAVQVHGVVVRAEDCNGNGIVDACDIATGTSLDGNTNGIPDECEGAAPMMAGGGGDVIVVGPETGAAPSGRPKVVPPDPVLAVLMGWGACPVDAIEPCTGDWNRDGFVDIEDLMLALTPNPFVPR